MISIKIDREIEIMRKAGRITAGARALAGSMVRPGVKTKDIDKAVYDFIVSHGAKPFVPALRRLSREALAFPSTMW